MRGDKKFVLGEEKADEVVRFEVINDKYHTYRTELTLTGVDASLSIIIVLLDYYYYYCSICDSYRHLTL